MDTDFIFYADMEQNEFTVYSDWELTLGAEDEEEAGSLLSRLVRFASEYSLSGNIWQQWIAYLLISDENPYSLACERHKVSKDATMRKLAEADFEEIFVLFNGGPENDDHINNSAYLPLFEDYKAPYRAEKENPAGRQISELAAELAKAKSASKFADIITRYYEEHGVGIYGLHRAFRLDNDDEVMDIIPVRDLEDVSFDTLIGCEDQIAALKSNTEAFLKGIPANNVLLYGDSGTGKSTSVHALMHDYFAEGLRLVELGKSDRKHLTELMAEIKKRNYKFIIFMDDLSFEEDESDYKELKAMLEGALESREDNVLIYATSNRRHLIRETWRDRNDMEFSDDVHRSDTMEEKLSLAGRFGVTIYYSKPDYKEYMNIVQSIAKREGLKISARDLEEEARKWSLRHGSTSGRTASQLIKWLIGRE